MIEADFFYNKNGDIYGFTIKNHGVSIVCAAVSALSINTVNAFKVFTRYETELNFNEKGGLIRLVSPAVKSGAVCALSRVLFGSLKTGLEGIGGEYPNNLIIRVAP